MKFRVFKTLSSWEILTDAPTAKDTKIVALMIDNQHADLLAAAPDMLEALEYIVSWDGGEWDGENARNKARAAIARARGQS